MNIRRVLHVLIVISVLMVQLLSVSAAYAQGSDTAGEPRYAIQPQFMDMKDRFGRSYYSSRLAFSDGVAFVDFNFIDKSGKVKFSFPVSEISDYPSFEGGLLIFESRGRNGVINSDGKIVVEPGYYDGITRFSKWLLKVKKNSKYGLIDRTGKEIVPLEYDEIGYLLRHGIAFVKKGKQSGAIDSTGKEVIKLQDNNDVLTKSLEIQFKYENQKKLPSSKMSLVQKDGKYYLADETGKETLLGYEYVTYTIDNMYLVRDNKKYGLIDSRTGKEVVKPKYDKINVVNERTFSVVLNGKLGFVDVTGKEFAKPQYDFDGEAYFENFLSGSKDLIRVEKNGKYGLIDYSGKEVVKPQFDRINNFSVGLAAVEINGLWGFIYDPLDVPSDWAKTEIETAILLSLVPDPFQYDYVKNITRADFCNLVVNLIELKNRKTISTLLSEKGKTMVTNTFSDTSDPAILAAYSLGIVGGKGDGIFDPDGDITRQEAAVMLARTAKILGISIDSSNVNFTDSNDIASWAKDSVSFVSLIKDKTNQSSVMSSTGNNNFSPNASYTKQQAFITMKRLSNSL